MDPDQLANTIRELSQSLGFSAIGFTHLDLSDDEAQLLDWLAQGHHGDMHYMQRHGTLRARPAELLPGAISLISVRLDYWPDQAAAPWPNLQHHQQAYISRYALGRDYHKLLRKRLNQLAKAIEQHTGPYLHRAYSDSAPILEKPLARNAGLGWIGKNSNLIHPQNGSWFFLGELLTDLPLPNEASAPKNHCGSCQACIHACPTDAIIAPQRIDARLCISYLTIEHKGPIPVELRPKLGNRIYGCDDCQLVCPWNKFAKPTQEPDFQPRHRLDQASLIELFQWTEQQFLDRLQGSPIRRIGHPQWLRNIAVALGNALRNSQDPDRQQRLKQTLEHHSNHPDPIVREHIHWALQQQPQHPPQA